MALDNHTEQKNQAREPQRHERFHLGCTLKINTQPEVQTKKKKGV